MAGPADAGGMLTRPRDAAAPTALGPVLLDAIFAQSPFSIAIYDRRGRVVAGNAAYERHWGIRLADVPADYSILDDPQLERDGLLALVRRAYAGEAVVLPVTRYDAAAATGGAGRVVWTQGHCYPVRDAAGEVTHVAVLHEDATARVESEQALRASERELAALFEAEQRTSAEARRAAERTARLQAATAALARAASPRDIAAVVLDQGRAAVGASAGSLYAVSADGRTLTAISRTGYPDAVAAATERVPVVPGRPMSDAVLHGTPVYVESADEAGRRYPDMGTLFHASGHEAMGILRVDAGPARYALAFSFREARALPAEDRAMLETLGALAGQALERAAAYEAERAARAEAEAANRAKSEFLAVMSHELRTPLNAIGGYAELMSLGIRGPVTEAQREDLDRIQRSQQHLLGLINEVLNYARLDAGSVRYESQDLPAVEAVASAVALVAPQARAKGIVLEAHGCAPNLLVRADPEKLRQVLINLLSNAVKFTERGGRVEVGCEPRDAAGEPPRTAIRVRDTGVGVPADKLEAIFEPFVQVDKRLTRTSEGVGLGLSISRDLARGMDGELTAASTPGAGSTFTLVLPRPM